MIAIKNFIMYFTNQFILAPVDAFLKELKVFVCFSASRFRDHHALRTGIVLFERSVIQNNQKSVLKQCSHADIAFVQLYNPVEKKL